MSLLNNSKILKSTRFNIPFTVVRPGVGAYDTDTGKWLEATPTETDASGSIQPVKSSDRLLLAQAMEGGQMLHDAIRIYSQFEFQPCTLPDRNGDQVRYRGLLWAVVSIEDFSAHGHQKVFGIRLDGQTREVASVTVSGTGTIADGFYPLAGTIDGKNYFDKGGEAVIQWSTSLQKWYLNAYPPIESAIIFENSTNTDNPPPQDWSEGVQDGDVVCPAPTIVLGY